MKQVILIFLLFFMVSSTYSSNEEYTFIIEFDHDFDENEDIECEVIFDDRDKNLDFDEDSKDDDFLYENEFEQTLEVICDAFFDEIEVEIIDENDDRIEKFDHDDSKGFKYTLDLVDEDDTWFEFKIEHDFEADEDINCDLEIDSKKYDYEFSEDSENFLFSRNYNNEFELDCNEEIDEVILVVYNNNEKEEFRETYTYDDRITFSNEDLELTYEFRLEFNHEFDSNDDDIVCDIEIDSEIYNEVSFEEDSRSSETRYIDDFKESIYVDCNEEVDEIILTVYLESGVELLSNSYEEEDTIEFDLDSGEFNFFIIIDDNFNGEDEVNCELFLDTRLEERFTLDSSSSITDKRQVGEFNEQLELICDEKLADLEMIIYQDEDSDENLLEETYTNQKEFSYFVTEPEIEDIVPVVIKEEVTEPIVVVEEEVKVNESAIEKKSEVPELETTEINTQIDQNTQNKVEEDNIDTISDKELTQNIDDHVTDINTTEESSSFSWFIVFLVILFILILVGVGYRNAPLSPSTTDKKRKNTDKRNIDFSFLNKKK